METRQMQTTGATAFAFTGRGDEYFRIWIVNLLLTLLTLGIYSAWAKVRRNRYFYGSTRLGDASFEYLAKPLAILKGRLLAVAAFVAYGVITRLWPLTAPLFGLAMFVALPWLVVRSLTFRARNTAFRNLRFDFKPAYSEAVVYFTAMPLLFFFTLGLIYPYVVWGQKRLIMGNSAYGQTPFRFGARPGQFYRIYGLALVLVIVLASGIVALAVVHRAALVLFVPAYLLVRAYTNVAVSNLVFNHTTLAEHAFRSRLRTRDLFWLYLSNALAIVATLGLFVPWARVRMARYRCASLELEIAGDLDHFVATERAKVGSAGEELGEMLDLDLAL